MATTEERQQALESVIDRLMRKDLADEDDLAATIGRLKWVYLGESGCDCDFRHEYSRISTLVFGGLSRSEAAGGAQGRKNPYYLDAVQRLADSLDVIRSEIADDESGHFKCMFGKLHDHVNLELVRINFNANVNQDQDERFSILMSQMEQHDNFFNSLNERVENEAQIIEKLSRRTDEVGDRLQVIQKDHIAILAIFAAVIMTFSGGFGFVAGSFSDIAKVDIDRVLCLAAFVGLVLIDLMYLLMSFIWLIVRRESGEICPLPSIKQMGCVNLALIAICAFLLIAGYLLRGDFIEGIIALVRLLH